MVNGDPQKPLKNEVKLALEEVSFGEYQNNDLLALDELHVILQANLTNPDAYTPQIRDIALKGLMQSLTNAYESSDLAHNEGDPEGSVVSQMNEVIQSLDDFITGLGSIDSTNQNQYFRYHLDKVHAYRAGGYYLQALNILANRSNWTFDYTQQMRSDFWNCICTAENDYYIGELSAEALSGAITTCNETYAGYNYKKPEKPAIAKEVQEVASFQFYPQPVEDRLYFNIIPLPEGEVEYQVYNLNGSLLQNGTIHHWQAEDQSIAVSSLSPGMYFMTLRLNAKTQRFRFIKQ